MRLSSLVVAVVLLFSSALFVQHSSTGGASSSPSPAAAPSSPPPAPAPSPSPSASSNTASSGASASSVSHTSAPSSPSPASIPESHAAPIPSSSGSHASGPSSSDWSASRAASPARSSEPNGGRVISGERLSGNEGRIVSSPRIGEAPLVKEKEKEKDRKTPEPDLRRRICTNGTCKEPEPNPEQADLRRRICTNAPCPCPPGQSADKNGNCITPPAPAQKASACQPNESWNGTVCMAANRCHAGESWNGAECVNPGQCAVFSSRASLLAMDARSIHRDKDAACHNDPYGQECMRLTQSYDSAVLSYEMLLNEAPVSCRTMLPDPLSL
jgi:hypothetical protein